jgi:hypothetical protein
MESELGERSNSKAEPLPKRLSSRIEPLAPYIINIMAIRPYLFYLTIKYKGNVYFYISIYNINRELESRNELVIIDKSELYSQD